MPVMAYLSIGAVRADAVFVSGLQRCDVPSAGQVRQAVADAAGWLVVRPRLPAEHASSSVSGAVT